MDHNDTKIPPPISWPPSSYWDGNDGLWNSFILSAGTPPQTFRVLPSTAGQETWLTDPAGCDAADPGNPGSCGYLRGSLPVDGTNSSGFQYNLSSTWAVNGIFSLDAPETNIGYDPVGLYGFDTVVLGNGSTASTLNLTNQVIASVGALDFWTGYFGLGPRAVNFSSFNDPVPCFMRDLVTQGKIPSLSWGYTAGAHYRDNASASLTLGGYDTMRFVDTNFSISMNVDNSRPLQVALESITAENTICGSASNMLFAQTFHFIDSTVPHLWLPDDVVDRFVDCFGLTYDNSTDLFLVNDTVHSRLLDLNPTLAFRFSNGSSNDLYTGSTIELPYAALDLQASYPFYQTATNYFPIRRAANDTQYTIGRTLLQEAYIVADFERSNFTIAQASFDNMATQDLVAITTVGSSSGNTPSTSEGKSALTGGVIAGIVVCIVAALCGIGVVLFIILRRRPWKSKERRQTLSTGYTHVIELSHDGHQRTELSADHALAELSSSDKSMAIELPTVAVPAELRGSPGGYGMASPFKR